MAERIRPVGIVEVKDASDLASMKTGEQVFAAQCTACHTAGALGAPKFGDADAWAPRIKTGFDALLHSALAGKGQMPPQGGGDFSDFEIARAVVYMANKGGAKFAEPKPPAAPAPRRAHGAATASAAAAAGRCRRAARRSPTPTAAARRPGRYGGADRRRRQRRRSAVAAAARGAAARRRTARALHAGLQRLPRRRRRRRAEVRRQGRLGAAPRAGHRRADRERDQGQGRDAAARAARTRAMPRSRPSSPTWSTRRSSRPARPNRPAARRPFRFVARRRPPPGCRR